MRRKFLMAILANLSATLSEILLMASSAWLIASAALHPPLSALSIEITLVRTAGENFFDKIILIIIFFEEGS